MGKFNMLWTSKFSYYIELIWVKISKICLSALRLLLTLLTFSETIFTYILDLSLLPILDRSQRDSLA